jgi:ABC-type branched-subunit amino acid transport system ATPase component
LPLALAVGDQFYVMENGQIVKSFLRDEVLAAPDRLANMLTVE